MEDSHQSPYDLSWRRGQGFMNSRSLFQSNGTLPGGRGPPSSQVGLYEVLRGQRHSCHAVPEVPQQGSPTQGPGVPA